MKKKTILHGLATTLLVIAETGYSMDAAQLVDETTFEDLLAMNVQVETVAKNNEILFDSPAAVFVITAEDIARFGAGNIPDALRMAPGVQVGQISTSEWAVGIRGHNGRYSRFIQVLIDGRSIYDPIFSGVNWDEHGLSIENVERIEVVRGPGGVVWGANAVNGVINIVRKSAAKQQGLSVEGGGGSQRYFTRASYGVSLSEQSFFSAYIKGQRQEGLKSANNFREDDWQSLLSGVSFEHTSHDSLIVVHANHTKNDNSYIGAFYDLSIPASSVLDIEQDNDNSDIHVKWRKTFDSDRWLNINLAYSRSRRSSNQFEANSKNTDLDIEYTRRFADRHQVNVGLNVSRVDSYIDTQPGFGLTLSPKENELSKKSLFFQDRVKVTSSLDLVFGLRFDNYSDSNDSRQYTLRGIWRPDSNKRVWASFSKAITTPNRITVDDSLLVISAAHLNSPLIPVDQQPFILTSQHSGGPLDNTELYAYELGARFLVSDTLSLDGTLYHYDYDNLLISGESDAGTMLGLGAEQSTDRSGVEVALSWKLNAVWSLQYTGSYVSNIGTQEAVNLEGFFPPALINQVPGLQVIRDDVQRLNFFTTEPESQHSIRLAGNLADNVQLGVWWRYIDDLDMTAVDAYSSVDIDIKIQVTKNLQIDFVAKNLFADNHYEFGRSVLGTETMLIPESYAVYFAWQY